MYTDHIALKWLQRIKESTGRLARWSMKLQAYHFTIHHKPGVKNQNADALSRRPYEQPTPEIMAFNCENSTVYTKVELFYENPSSIPYVPCVFAADTAESQPINQLIPFQKKQMMWTLFHLSIQAFLEN